MIDPAKAAVVKNLLAKRRPQNEVARLTGVSRATVQRIARGVRRVEPLFPLDQIDELALTFTPEQRARYEVLRAKRIAREGGDRAA